MVKFYKDDVYHRMRLQFKNLHYIVMDNDDVDDTTKLDDLYTMYTKISIGTCTVVEKKIDELYKIIDEQDAKIKVLTRDNR